MKIYSIGRDINCNIVIDDNTDVISRRHATLNVSSSEPQRNLCEWHPHRLEPACACHT